ncbi:AAA family ATPase [Methylocystis sp. ATCC 49242]|uniref:AAA family ATPase n=1 Tax=Methylocystis sp. ATCC 49242 TaxID=622637 RepID=UPI0001F8868D|nr:AAA family ATPase [Methylocystis sp. ATCC 49242]
MTLAPSPPWRRQPSPPPAPTDDAPSPLAVALDYIERGWSPIPISFRSKAPSLPGWTDLRISADEASRYFNGAPCNIGVALGEVSGGLVDVDLDCREAIAAAPYFLQKTAAIFGRETARASHWLYYTNSASVNLSANVYFDDPIAKERGAKARLVDLRLGPKVQTVFPGSAHEDTSEPIAWEPGCDGEPARVECDDLLRRVERLAACSLLARHWPAHGARHDARLAVGGVLVRAGFSESESKLFAEALARAVDDEDVRDFQAAIRSTHARANSGSQFSGLPTLCDTFGDAIGRAVADWLRLDESGADFGQSLLGPKPRATIVQDGVVADAETGEILSQPQANQALHPRIIRPTPFVWRDPATIPMRQWLYGRRLIRKFVSSTIALPGVGKSALGLAEDVAMTSGRSILGQSIESELSVWSWNGEDPLEELERRIAAICLHYHVRPEEIGGRLFLDSGRDQEIIIARAERNGFTIATPVVSAVKQAISDCRIDVLRIDPFVSCHRVVENDNGAIDAVVKAWAKIADETGCAIELVHHSRKTGGGEVTVEHARGASALLGAVRSARVLNSMTEDEGARAGVDNHKLYFRADNGKANLAPPPEGSDWFRMVSVPLGNGGMREGDMVGVVTPWQWPDALDGLCTDDLRKVQDALAEGEHAANVQAANWAGRAVAEALCLDIENAADKARVKSLLKVWLKNGVLKIEARHSPRDGRDRQYITVGVRA